MKTYAIRRRSAWKNAQELEVAAGVSMRVGNEDMSNQVRWIRSYVVQEADGRLGTLCIYQCIDEQAIREHARRAGLQADEVTEVVNTGVVRDDPAVAAAS